MSEVGMVNVLSYPRIGLANAQVASRLRIIRK
jgi:hypothetical protein